MNIAQFQKELKISAIFGSKNRDLLGDVKFSGNTKKCQNDKNH